MTDNDRAIATREAGSVIEQVIVKGDLSSLAAADRARYYVEVCQSIGVNPLTQPFQYITLNGRLTLYATRGCTDQLRDRRKITSHIVSREKLDGIYVVTTRVTVHAGTPEERSDEAIGAVNIEGLKGDALANALMKAETKSKRRATLSLVGLGWLDETEVEAIPGARPVVTEVIEGEVWPGGSTQPAARPQMAAGRHAEAQGAASDGQAKPSNGRAYRKRLIARWEELYQQAAALGLKHIAVLDANAPDEQIERWGRELAARIAEAQRGESEGAPGEAAEGEHVVEPF